MVNIAISRAVVGCLPLADSILTSLFRLEKKEADLKVQIPKTNFSAFLF
jgi:hypothetical protein